MLDAMRRLNLEPPRFQDKRASFWVTFRNHTLLGPETIAWLNHFAGHLLNDRQRLALAYLHHNEQLTNSDYRRLNHTDSVTANRELRGLVQSGLLVQHSTRRWAHYTLCASAETLVVSHTLSVEDRILAYIKEYGSINNAECRDLLGIESRRATYLLGKLHTQGILVPEGKQRWVRYRLP